MKKYILLLVLVFCGKSLSAQPSSAPVLSLDGELTYFNPADPNMASNFVTGGKSVICIINQESSNTTSGTASVIRTIRDDGKYCMLLSGHQVNDFFQGTSPQVNDDVYFLTDIYMNYYGKDSIVTIMGQDYHLNRAIKFSKGSLGVGKLVAYHYSPNGNDDIALVLINGSELPAASFTALGYDFAQTDLNQGTYESIGYSFAYPQRIIRGTFDEDLNAGIGFNNPAPYGSGPGASGSPIFKSNASGAGIVRGVIFGAYSNQITEIEDADLFNLAGQGSGKKIRLANKMKFTKLNTIEQEIRNHCWRKTDSAQISINSQYKQSADINNSSAISPYMQSQAFSTATAVAAAGNTTQGTSNIQTSYIKANICTMGSFALPATFPSTNYPWRVSIAAKQIDINGDFEYTASGNAVLNLATVVIDGVTQSSINANTCQIPADAKSGTVSQMNVYPNPSYDGIFNLEFAQTGNYVIHVYSTDGREVYTTQLNGVNTHTFDLSGWPHGTYVLSVAHVPSGKQLYHQMLVY